MTQSEAEQLLLEIVGSLQQASGREQIEMSRDTRPILDLPDFDSLNGVELTVEVMDRLGVEFEINNLLVDEKNVLSIGDAAARLLVEIEKHTEKEPN